MSEWISKWRGGKTSDQRPMAWIWIKGLALTSSDPQFTIYKMGIIKSFGTRCYDGEIKLEGTHIKHPAPRRCSMPIPFTLLVFCSLGSYGLTKCLLMVPSEPACQCRRFKRRGFDPWVGKIPWRKVRQPTSVFLPGGSQGQKSLAGYRPWGPKESDTTVVT